MTRRFPTGNSREESGISFISNQNQFFAEAGSSGLGFSHLQSSPKLDKRMRKYDKGTHADVVLSSSSEQKAPPRLATFSLKQACF